MTMKRPWRKHTYTGSACENGTWSDGNRHEAGAIVVHRVATEIVSRSMPSSGTKSILFISRHGPEGDVIESVEYILYVRAVMVPCARNSVQYPPLLILINNRPSGSRLQQLEELAFFFCSRAIIKIMKTTRKRIV